MNKGHLKNSIQARNAYEWFGNAAILAPPIRLFTLRAPIARVTGLHMACCLVVISLSALFPRNVSGQELDIVVRTSTDPVDEVLVGQKIKLTIDVLAKDAWASLSRLPKFEIPGAIVYSPGAQSLRLNESLGGDSYTGQRYEWWVYPRRTGPISIGAVEIVVRQKVFGANSDLTEAQEKTKPIKLIANYPAGVKFAKELICAENLEASEIWTPSETESLKVGDGVTRIITRTIGGAPGMLLPTIPPEQLDGVRAYPKQPSVSDASNRGNLVGNREDSVTYVFESGGSFTFPAKKFVWWNEGSKQLETIELPERIFEVIAQVENAESDPAPEQNIVRVGLPALVWLTVGLLLVAGIYFSRNRIGRKYNQLIASPIFIEHKAFNSLVAAARSDNTSETVGHLYRWMNFPLNEQRAPQLHELLRQFGSGVETSAVQDLMSAQCSADWDANKFILACKRIRKNWRRGSVQIKGKGSFTLPEINP